MIGSRISIFLLTATYMISAFFTTFLIFRKLYANKEVVSKRIKAIHNKQDSPIASLGKSKKKKKANANGEFKLVFNAKLMDKLLDELMLASIPLKAEEFLVIWLVVVIVPSMLALLFTTNIMPAIALAIIGAVVPIIIIKSKKKKRTEQFEAQLGDALMIVCNCLRSGLTFQQAMDTIAADMSPPISVEFSRAVNEIRYGNNTETALNNMSNRIKSADLMLAVSAVNIQRQTGGNLSEILETISQTIKDRIKIKSDIRTMTSQGRMSGLIIGALPIAMFLILMVINPDYMMIFFEETIGKIMLAVAIVLEILGYVVIRKVVDIKY